MHLINEKIKIIFFFDIVSFDPFQLSSVIIEFILQIHIYNIIIVFIHNFRENKPVISLLFGIKRKKQQHMKYQRQRNNQHPAI